MVSKDKNLKNVLYEEPRWYVYFTTIARTQSAKCGSRSRGSRRAIFIQNFKLLRLKGCQCVTLTRFDGSSFSAFFGIDDDDDSTVDYLLERNQNLNDRPHTLSHRPYSTPQALVHI